MLQRLSYPLKEAKAFDVYRQLRVVNPSPYMFYLDLGSFQVHKFHTSTLSDSHTHTPNTQSVLVAQSFTHTISPQIVGASPEQLIKVESNGKGIVYATMHCYSL